MVIALAVYFGADTIHHALGPLWNCVSLLFGP